MRRVPLSARRTRTAALAVALASVVSLFAAATAAEAVVVDVNPSMSGQATVPYTSSSLGDYAGVALVPGTRANLTTAGIPTVVSSLSPCDPFLTADLSLLPSVGLCSHGGAVMHASETFALNWDPGQRYGALTRGYMEQFLKDVADSSGTFSSPYAVTTQYQDTGGRAANSSTYGGACVDYGNPGGYTCQFGTTTGTGTGNNYPANGCAPSAGSQVCLTDAQIQSEVATHLNRTGLLGNMVSGHTPLLVVLTPPSVEICVNSAGTLCSANATSTAQFCSYHSQVNYGGTEVPYVLQPFTPGTACDEPNLAALPQSPTAQDIAAYSGSRMVSPLSQAQIAATVNPNLDGWFAENGSEINDNYGCAPGGDPADKVTVGGSAQNPYYLQPEFNNAGVIFTDPSVPACALNVTLAPNFVVPSAVKPGDIVQFDGSITPSTLIVPKLNYVWSYGDGTSASGPSVEHTYAKPGNYAVTLSVTDRGGNSASVSKTISILGSPAPPTPTSLKAHLQLMPQGLKALLLHGVSLRVSSNKPVAGIVTLSITRSAAKRAHIRTGRGATVIVGRGTVSGLASGVVSLHVRLSRTMATKLGHLRHVTLTVRMALRAAGGAHVVVDAAGRY